MALTRRTLRRTLTRRPKRAPTRKSASRTKRVSLWRQVNYSDPSDPMTLRLSTVRLTNSMNPFPPSMICDLQYVDYGTVSSTGATTSTGAEYAFRLNSLFDPNLTGAGHQPRYFDQLTNIYQLYRVYKCSFQVEFYKPASTTMFCAGQVRNSQDTYTLSTKSPVNVGEADGSWLQYARDDGTPLVFSGVVKIPDADGLTYAAWLANDNYAAPITANPNYCPVVSIAAGDEAAPVGSQSILFHIKLVYHCKLWGLITPSSS